MNFTHQEMMLIIQGLRLINGIDKLGEEFTPTDQDRIDAMNLLIDIDNERE